MAAASAAAASHQQQQKQEREAVFAAAHAELLSEARGVAREFGVSVRAVACRPDGTAVSHQFNGVGRERVAEAIGRLAAKDVAAMGLEEAAAHERKLLCLRALVARELQARAAARARGGAAAAVAAGASKRAASGQQEAVAGAGAGAGSNKIRRTG